MLTRDPTQKGRWNCLVPRRLSLDENVRAKESGKETTGETTRRLLSVPFPWSLAVHHQSLASTLRKTKRLRRRLTLKVIRADQEPELIYSMGWDIAMLTYCDCTALTLSVMPNFSRSSERILILVFLWYKATDFRGIAGDCRLTAPTDFIRGISAGKMDSFRLD